MHVKYIHSPFFCSANCSLKDGYIVVNLRLLPLCDALSDPDDVTTLLLLQFDVGVKYCKVELLHKRKCIQLHLEKQVEAAQKDKIIFYIHSDLNFNKKYFGLFHLYRRSRNEKFTLFSTSQNIYFAKLSYF